MIKNLQGMLSPSKKKRTFQTDQSIAVNDPHVPTDAGPLNNTPEKTGRLMRMNVLKTPPRLTDDDDDHPANESSPRVFARRRKSSKGEELSFSPSYEEAKAGIKGNIRGFFNRRKSATAKSEEVVLSPAESNDMYEDSEVEDIERSYLEEIFKRKQASMHSDGQEEEEEPSEQQFSSADNKSRRGRRRSVTKLIAESRKRDEEQGNSPRDETPAISDNHSRRRRRSVHARPFEESPNESNDSKSSSVRPRRSSLPSVEDNDKVDVTDRRTRRGRRSMIEENRGTLNVHEDERRARRHSHAVGNTDDMNDRVANDRKSRRGQRIIQDIVDKHSSEDKPDRKLRRTHRSLEIRDEGDTKINGEAHSQTRNMDSDRHRRRATSRSRNRSRSPIAGSRNRSRSLSKHRHHDRSPTRKRSKSRRRASEVQVTRERRRSRSRHRPSLASLKKDDDDGHRSHGTGRDVNTTKERDNNADRHKNRDRDNLKDRENHRDKERDRRRERDRGGDRERRSSDQVSERGSHANESGVGESRSRRKSANDDHSSARSYLSDSASTFDSFMRQIKAENSFSSADDGSRGGHATAKVRVPTSRGSMSKSKNKLTSYLPSDERIRLKHNLEIKSPSSKEKRNKQKVEELHSKIEAVTPRRGPDDKRTKPKTGECLSSRDDARNESLSEERDTVVSNNSRSMAKEGKVVMDGSEGTTDPATSPGERRSRSRRVALTSILDSDVGGEREADILSLSSSPSKPIALDPDRDRTSGSGFRLNEHGSVSNSLERNNNMSKTGTSAKGGASSSTLKDEASYNFKSNGIIKGLESLPTEADILIAASDALDCTDQNSGVDGRRMAAKNEHLDLTSASSEDKAIMKVAKQRNLSGNEEMLHSDMDSAALNRKPKDINHQDLIKMSREQRLGSKEGRTGRELSPTEPVQDSVLASPLSRRSHDSRKSVKGMTKRGDTDSRTKPHTRDHHDNSPLRKNARNRRSKDESSHDSKLSTWRPPRIKERTADTRERISHRRRGSSHRMEGLRELDRNDATPVDYNEQDVFSLYSWSGNRQSEDKIQRERLALKNSIRGQSLFRAYENIETA